MAALYEISNNQRLLLDLLEDEEVTEEGFEAIADTMESLEGDFSEKMEACIMIMRNYEAEAESCEKEEKRFAERKKAATNKAERLKAYMLRCMQVAEMTKLNAGRFKVSRRNAGGKLPVKVLCDPRDLPEEFLTVTTTYAPNKDAMLQFLEAGNQSEQFFLGERSQYISIK